MNKAMGTALTLGIGLAIGAVAALLSLLVFPTVAGALLARNEPSN